MRRRWLFGAAVLVGAWLFIFLFHRAPKILLFDQAWVSWNLLPLPFSANGMHEAIRWQMTVHTPEVLRPARAILWWLETQALGCGPAGYYVFNGVALGAATWAAWLLAAMLTGSRRRALVVALGAGATYATILPLLYFGYAQPAFCAYLGLAAWFCAETGESGRRGPLRVAAVVLVVLATLMHETYLAYAVVPLLHAIVVRRTRPALARAAAFLGIVPVYAVLRAVQGWAFGIASSWLGVIVEGAQHSPDKLVENPGRVLFAMLTGGLPLDPLRAMPWFPEFARIREMMLGAAGLATLAAVLAPTLGLAALALAAARHDTAARRRTIFYLLWLAAGSLPLTLPVGTPEAVHLVGALPALFLLWSEAFAPGAGRAAVAAAWVLLAAWTGVHLGARWVLFHRDIPAMSRAVQALHHVFLDAQRAGTRAAVLFVPAQIGGHYGMLPTVPALYRDRAGRCVRGDHPAGDRKSVV